MQQVVAVYNSDELDDETGDGGSGDNNIHLKDWLKEGRRRLDESREALSYLCAPVALPRAVEQYLRYFCGDAADADALNDTEALRISFYKAVVTFVRAFAAMAQELAKAGYSEAESAALTREVEFYNEIRAAIKRHSGEELDIKPFEADMRHLINAYTQANAVESLGTLDNLTLVEAIVESGIHDAIAQRLNRAGSLSPNAVAEGIINNVRKTILRDQLTDPRFYAEMSQLLDDLIRQRRDDTVAYAAFLRQAEELARRLVRGQSDAGLPVELRDKREAAVIYHNLPAIMALLSPALLAQIAEGGVEYGHERLRLALAVDRVMREEAPAAWRGDETRRRQVQNALYAVMHRDRTATQALFDLVHKQAGYA